MRSSKLVNRWPALLSLIVTGIFSVALSARGDVIITDDFSDNEVAKPTTSVAGTLWVIDKGEFAVDGLRIGDNLEPRAGELNFGAKDPAEIHIDLGKVAKHEQVKVVFTLRTPNEGLANYTFSVELRDKASGEGYTEKMAGNAGFYGTSGFMSYNDSGEVVAGLADAFLTVRTLQRIEITFDELDGIVVKKDDEVVASWKNFKKLESIDQLILRSDGVISWFVTDVSIEAKLK